MNYTTGRMALASLLIRIARREPMMSGFYNRTTIITAIMYLLWIIGIFYSRAQDRLVDQIYFDLVYQILLLVVLPLLVLDIVDLRRAMTGTMILGSIISVL